MWYYHPKYEKQMLWSYLTCFLPELSLFLCCSQFFTVVWCEEAGEALTIGPCDAAHLLCPAEAVYVAVGHHGDPQGFFHRSDCL